MTTATKRPTPAAVERFPYSRETELEWLIKAHTRMAAITGEARDETLAELRDELNELRAGVPR